MTALEMLAEITFAVQHNPNCPSQYCVRLVGESGRIDYLGTETKDILGFGSTLQEAAENALRKQRELHQKQSRLVICDDCNVEEPHEHRCHGKDAMVRGERTGRPCECYSCALFKLPHEEVRKIACANHLGISSKAITRVEIETNADDDPVGLNVNTYIHIGPDITGWIGNHLPKL